jgi:hypothetical protein
MKEHPTATVERSKAPTGPKRTLLIVRRRNRTNRAEPGRVVTKVRDLGVRASRTGPIACGLALALGACSSGPNTNAKAACRFVYQYSAGHPGTAVGVPASIRAEFSHSGSKVLEEEGQVLLSGVDLQTTIQAVSKMTTECSRIGVKQP